MVSSKARLNPFPKGAGSWRAIGTIFATTWFALTVWKIAQGTSGAALSFGVPKRNSVHVDQC
ncbi:MAG: hypothetical protein DMG70_27935 [Acidobacteria bacterium]|nr:MAG: hypothetical protein DMG70_27935 [Acidobacteriota bacterium]